MCRRYRPVGGGRYGSDATSRNRVFVRASYFVVATYLDRRNTSADLRVPHSLRDSAEHKGVPEPRGRPHPQRKSGLSKAEEPRCRIRGISTACSWRRIQRAAGGVYSGQERHARRFGRGRTNVLPYRTFEIRDLLVDEALQLPPRDTLPGGGQVLRRGHVQCPARSPRPFEGAKEVVEPQPLDPSGSGP